MQNTSQITIVGAIWKHLKRAMLSFVIYWPAKMYAMLMFAARTSSRCAFAGQMVTARTELNVVGLNVRRYRRPRGKGLFLARKEAHFLKRSLTDCCICGVSVCLYLHVDRLGSDRVL